MLGSRPGEGLGGFFCSPGTQGQEWNNAKRSGQRRRFSQQPMVLTSPSSPTEKLIVMYMNLKRGRRLSQRH
jgi:hypothetical protein